MRNRLFMTADDLTGALDSGVQFSKHNLKAIVVGLPWAKEIPEDCDAVIVCTDTRHVAPEDARATVRSLFRAAKESGRFTCYFKKLDSTLRGNVGAEIAGMLEGAGAENAVLLNAFPAAGRTTKGGLQYVNGVPLSETAFASDPFNPITTSRIADIITAQADIAEKIAIMDAETDLDIDNAVREMAQHDSLTYLAGCAGLADGLARLWHREKEETTTISGNPAILCGSLNPIAHAQLKHAEENGFTVRTLSEAFISSDGLVEIPTEETIILRTPDPTENVTDADGAAMAEVMGRLFKSLIASGHTGPTLVIGGDTLSACIRAANLSALEPLGEPIPGTVILRASENGNSRLLLSRAGGFGGPDAITKIIRLMKEGISI